MASDDGVTAGGERATLADRAVRRGLAAVRETARSDVGALMDAGLALMVESGGRTAPRVADIVAAAGLSNDTFYRYFAGKDALVAAIVEQGAHTVVSYVRHRIAAAAPAGPAAQLRAGVEAIMKQASDSELATKTRAVLSNAAAMPPGTRHISVALVDSLAELFTAPAEGLGAADPVRAARTVAAAAVAQLQYHLFKEEVPDEGDLARLVGFLLAGTTAPAGEPPDGTAPPVRSPLPVSDPSTSE